MQQLNAARLAIAKGGEDIELTFCHTTVRLIGTGKVADNIHRLAHIFALAQTLVKRLCLAG
jgi:hypothetical protein